MRRGRTNKGVGKIIPNKLNSEICGCGANRNSRSFPGVDAYSNGIYSLGKCMLLLHPVQFLYVTSCLAFRLIKNGEIMKIFSSKSQDTVYFNDFVVFSQREFATCVEQELLN